MNAAKERLFSSIINNISAQGPTLYGPNGKQLRPTTSYYNLQRTAAKKKGSMQKWSPSRLYSKQTEEREREDIALRSTDLVNNDPHAAGVVETFANTVVGPGLRPHFALDMDKIGLTREASRAIQKQMLLNFFRWEPFADIGQRMSFGGVQFLLQRNLIQFGEFFVLLPMASESIDTPFRLRCQVIHPLRVKTPSDKFNDPNIRDGIELGPEGNEVAIWVKKSPQKTNLQLSDSSENFVRILTKQGHRHRVIHGFVVKEPDQVRGYSAFANGMKFFRDFNDLLDAELVSNVVTAAFSMFVEVGEDVDPLNVANNLTSFSETVTNRDGDSETYRYQEMIPGQIMYGNSGEKPHILAAQRPGVTFEPFTKVVKKAIATSLNVPYQVLFKDVEGVNFAGFRSAMLEAWRVFSAQRKWLGDNFCQPVFTMLQEEAWLREMLDYDNFLLDRHILTRAEWRGTPKGDIEPIKAVNADILAIKNNLKTYEEAIAERGGEYMQVFDKREEEEQELEARGLKLDTENLESDMKEADKKEQSEGVESEEEDINREEN